MPWFTKRAILVAAACCVGTSSAHAQLKAWTATEQWRVDGTQGGEPFGDLRDYVVLKDGTLWVLDFKDQVIRRYSADGKPLSTVGRKGSGPGEIRNANGMLVAPNGMVWVNDPSNGRFTVFSPDGKLDHQVMISIGGYAYRWNAWFDEATNDLLDQRMSNPAGWRRVNVQGNVVGNIEWPTCSNSSALPNIYRAESKNGHSIGSYPLTTGGGLAVDGHGNAWCATPMSTRVALIKLVNGDTVAQTTIDIPRIKVEREERDVEIAKVQKSIATYATNDFDASKVPNSKSGIAALEVDDDGRLWVQHSDVFGAKQSANYDIFDAAGKHLGRLTIPVKSRSYIPIRARGDALWITVLDDDDVPSVAKFRITR